jgi:hypothetical protein
MPPPPRLCACRSRRSASTRLWSPWLSEPSAPAVFAQIGSLVPGDEIIVTLSDGSALTFAVGDSIQSAKAEFPTDAVYSNVPTPELRLITCGGTFDSSTGHYLDNLIVFAELRA